MEIIYIMGGTISVKKNLSRIVKSLEFGWMDEQ